MFVSTLLDPSASLATLGAVAAFAAYALYSASRPCTSPTSGPCSLQTFETERDVGEALARVVAELVLRKPNARILFQTGSTPIRSGFFASLKDMKEDGEVDFSRMHVVGGDEYAGVPLSHPGCFASYLTKHVVAPLGVNPSNVLFLDGAAKDLQAECARFEASLRAQPLDLCLLGLGLNGHVAFNDPPSASDSITRVVQLTPESIATSKSDLPERSPAQLPTHALTIGIATIRECAARVIILATGASKDQILHHVFRGPVGHLVPASQLRNDRHVTFFMDAPAARLLK